MCQIKKLIINPRNKKSYKTLVSFIADLQPCECCNQDSESDLHDGHNLPLERMSHVPAA